MKGIAIECDPHVESLLLNEFLPHWSLTTSMYIRLFPGDDSEEERPMNNHFQFDGNRALGAKMLFEQMDNMRRAQGKMFDSAGLGPIETPYQVLHTEPGVRLRKYIGGTGKGTPLLIVPAPIKRSYIWDLSPETSVIRRCLAQDMQVYLADWSDPEETDQYLGLTDYGERLLKTCFDIATADSNSSDVVMAGHSLGGVLATIFACLHPQQIRALVLLEAPLHFGADAGDFAPLVAAVPDSRPIGNALGNVPGSFLNLVSLIAAPHAFQWERQLDLAISISNLKTLDTHVRVERWTRDEFALPGQLFTDIVEVLYRGDQLMQGRLLIDERQIGPQDLRAPLLNVIDPRSTVIPPASILPFHEAAASQKKKILQYEGDIGVAIQHVGILVGSNAHAVVWPAIFEWLDEFRDGP
jgi:polyhydroxyalkanoate synthase